MARPGRWDLDMDGDFRIADGPETIELFRLQSDHGYAVPVTCEYALRETVNKRTAAGQVEAADLVWHLDADEVGAEGVRPGDRLRDSDGINWDVTGATLAGASDQWRVPAIKVPDSGA